jgi:hypothetical protein
MTSWYQKNRDEVLRKMRERYANDKEFRERKIEKTTDRYYAKKQSVKDMVVKKINE